MGAVVALAVSFEQINCGECGGSYALIERYVEQKREKKGGWHCPYCQVSWGYFGKSEADRLKEALKAEQERHQRTLALKNEAEAEAKKLAASAVRLKRRVSNGVCPCCKRTFKQLARHMECKHPDYAIKEKKNK